MTVTVYDGQCVICNSTRRMVTALDWLRRIKWLDLHQRDTVEARYPWLDYERAMGEIHVIDSQEDIYAGYFGVRRMLRDLPLGLPVWALLHLPGMDWVGQRVYRWVARNRYEINRAFGVECDDGMCKIP